MMAHFDRQDERIPRASSVREQVDTLWAKPNPAEERSKAQDGATAKSNDQARRDHSGYADELLFRQRKRITSATDFIKNFAPPELVIPGLNLRKRAVYSMTGRTSHGKTTIVIRLSLSKAGAWEFAGQPVPIGRVLIAGENPEDHQMRLVLAQHKYGLSDDVTDRIQVFPYGFPMQKHVDEVVAMATDLGPFDLVFVETSAAYFHGPDEDANVEMRENAVACRSLIRISGQPCVVVACHPPKAANNAETMLPRGGGAFLNEMDGNMSVFSADIGVTTTLHWTGKWRGQTFEPLTFKLLSDTAPSLKTTAGRALYSVLAEPMSEAEAEKEEERQTEDHLALLEKMLAVWPGTLSLGKLSEALGWKYKSRAQRAMEHLSGLKLVAKNLKVRWELTNKGRKDGSRLMRKARPCDRISDRTRGAY